MNQEHTNPPDIARETLKTLAMRKIPPTPDNYGLIYAQISGIAAEERQGPQQVLKRLAEQLHKQSGKNGIVGKQVLKALSDNDWELVLDELSKALPLSKEDHALIPSWSELIKDLLRQLEIPHKGLTLSRKKEGLETVLTRFSANPDTLFEKLNGLIRSWSSTARSGSELVTDTDSAETPLSTETSISASPVSSPAAETATSDKTLLNQDIVEKLRELLIQALQQTASIEPDFIEEVNTFTAKLRATSELEQITQLAKQLRAFWLKIELRGSDKNKIQEGLIRLLRLLVENVGELVEDEGWLHGQITSLQGIIENPIDKFVLADAERSLREAIIKQSLLKQSLSEAKTTLKMLMTTFIDRLGELTESTGEYSQKIEGYSRKIGNTNNITELSHLLEDIMQDTRVIQASALRSHEELLTTRKQAHEAEAKIKELEQELEEISELVREDQLTGALNRRGLDEAFEREATRCDRSDSPLCIALLDIDNFKRLNDTLGHQAGDGALIHLTSVIKEALRPSDTVARYGGEEFVILLPDISLEDARLTIVRLQRELTKKFFLHDNDRVLITFSAGIAVRASGEDLEYAIGRADKAMYKAKTSGKNQVILAD